MNKKPYSTRQCTIRQAGLSLLELIISIAIGSVLVLAITSVFVQFHRLSDDQKIISLMMDEANGAFLDIDRDIRMSGAGLCVNPFANNGAHLSQRHAFPFNGRENTPNVTELAGMKLGRKTRLHSWHITAANINDFAGITPTGSTLKLDSDILLVFYADPEMVRVCNINGKACGNLQRDETSRFDSLTLASPLNVLFYNRGGNLAPTWFMLSDCDDSEVLYYAPNSSLKKNSDTLPPPVGGDYDSAFSKSFYKNGSNAWITRLRARAYFVTADNTLYVRDLLAPKNKNGDPSTAEALSNNVLSMSIDWLDSSNSWVKTEKRTDWSGVWPARIELKMEGSKNATDDETFSRVIGSRN